MKKTTTKTKTIPQDTDKGTTTTLDAKIFDALRAEVREVTKELEEKGVSLSPRVLLAAGERLRDVARFAGTFEAHGIPANGVAITETGSVTETQPYDDARAARDAKIYAMRNENPPKKWREIFDETGLTISQARDAAKRHERSLAKNGKGK